jgi:hypothetical protein
MSVANADSDTDHTSIDIAQAGERHAYEGSRRSPDPPMIQRCRDTQMGCRGRSISLLPAVGWRRLASQPGIDFIDQDI